MNNSKLNLRLLLAVFLAWPVMAFGQKKDKPALRVSSVAPAKDDGSKSVVGTADQKVAKVCSACLPAGFDVNHNFYGETPLHMAAKKGHLGCVAYLLLHGADVKALTTHCNGSSVLHFACSPQRVSHGFELRKDDLINEDDRGAMVSLLLNAGAQVLIDEEDRYGDTALYCAAQSLFDRCTLILLASGANVNSVSCNGFTPLHSVVSSYWNDDYAARVDLVKLLILNGADPDLRSYGNTFDRFKTVGELAVIHGHVGIPKIITDAQKERVELCKLSSKILSVDGPTALSQLPKELIAIIVAYADNHVIFTLNTLKEMGRALC